jgi:hypothetical protein
MIRILIRNLNPNQRTTKYRLLEEEGKKTCEIESVLSLNLIKVINPLI